MAYSYMTSVGDGQTQLFSLPFQYLSKRHVYVLVDGLEANFSWHTRSTVLITPTPKAGAVVRIERRTPIDSPPADFSEGALITANDLDVLSTYYLFVAQEGQDRDEQATLDLNLNNIDGGTF